MPFEKYETTNIKDFKFKNKLLIKLSLNWLDTLTNVVHLLNCLSEIAPT